MKLHGTYSLRAPREVVFEAICDPGVLMEVVPGCEAIEQVSPTEYQGRLSLRLPGIAGSYRTTVRLVDVVPPDRSGMEGHLEGAMGSIDGRADFVLAGTAASTTLEYDGHAVIQGPLARLDSRFAERLAESLIAQGLRSLDVRLARDASPAGDPGADRPAVEGRA